MDTGQRFEHRHGRGGSEFSVLLLRSTDYLPTLKHTKLRQSSSGRQTSPTNRESRALFQEDLRPSMLVPLRHRKPVDKEVSCCLIQHSSTRFYFRTVTYPLKFSRRLTCCSSALTNTVQEHISTTLKYKCMEPSHRTSDNSADTVGRNHLLHCLWLLMAAFHF